MLCFGGEEKTMTNQGTPIVSISCLVYNHEPFLRQCLDGFVMQQTDFPFEVLIHDDASTDGSADIIREYERKYPDIIKPVYETENQWVLGRRGSAVFNFPRAKGLYFALCEGDDYWTDPLKLQKQVDFLEANPDYSMCFHSAMNLWDDGRQELFSIVEDRIYTAEDIMSDWMVPTASILFRKDIVFSDFYQNTVLGAKLFFGDTPLFLSCARFGKVRGLPDCMSVYRRHEGSISRGFTSESYWQLIHYCSQLGDIFELPNLADEAVVRNAVDGFFHSLRSSNESVDVAFIRKAFTTRWQYAIKVLWLRFTSRFFR